MPTADEQSPILASTHEPDKHPSMTEETLSALKPLIVIAGPTAVGKTSLGVALAHRFGGEVVNADSRYLYQGLDIGVAKPTIFERQGISHHLIDILDPTESMTLARYQELAKETIAGSHARGALPFLVGGTPLYVNAVVEGWRIPKVPPDPEFRAAHEAAVAAGDLPLLLERLRAVDPVAAARSATNPRRIIRALEVFHATGRPMSELEGKGPRPFLTLELGPTLPRDRLHRAIDARVDDQIRRGLVAEVQALLDAGVPPDAPAMSSLGYRQLFPFLRGEEPLDAAIARIKTDTHRYVRHQETWLRKNANLVPVDVTRNQWEDDVVDLVARFMATQTIPTWSDSTRFQPGS